MEENNIVQSTEEQVDLDQYMQKFDAIESLQTVLADSLNDLLQSSNDQHRVTNLVKYVVKLQQMVALQNALKVDMNNVYAAK